MKKIIRTCKKCKKEFEDTASGQRKFCSAVCYRKSRPGKTRIKCRNLKCGKIFSAYKGRSYCCNKCMYSDAAWIKKQRSQIHSLATIQHLSKGAKDRKSWSGENNPMYKHGTYSLFSSILKKADGMCTFCKKGVQGHSEFLDIHHKDRNHQNNTESNLAAICPNCHRKEHMKNWKKSAIHSFSKEKAELPTLIFEGPDGSGKTNIATEFVALHPEYSYFKLKKEKLYIQTLTSEEIKMMHMSELTFLTSLLEQLTVQAVFDRSWVSEIVYGQAIRHYDKKQIRWLYHMDERLSKTNTKIVLFWKKNKDLHDDIFSDQELKIIKHGYREYITHTKFKPKDVLVMDTSDRNLKEQLKKIEKFIYG